MHGFVSLHIPVGYMIEDRKESTDFLPLMLTE